MPKLTYSRKPPEPATTQAHEKLRVARDEAESAYFDVCAYVQRLELLQDKVLHAEKALSALYGFTLPTRDEIAAHYNYMQRWKRVR